MTTAMRHRWSSLVEWVSFEVVLTRLGWPNGGAAVLFRSISIALVIYVLALLLLASLDPHGATIGENRGGWNIRIASTLHWYGAIFAGTYAGLYAKFASQWTYLANLYNQIKAAECSPGCDSAPLAEWKAGYLEDALELHLALKPNVASIIQMWGAQPCVERAFKENTPGGASRFEPLMQAVRNVCERTRERSLK